MTRRTWPPKKKELVNRIRRLKAEISQLLTDAESWNDNRPDAPIDAGRDELLREYDALDRQLRSLSTA